MMLQKVLQLLAHMPVAAEDMLETQQYVYPYSTAGAVLANSISQHTNIITAEPRKLRQCCSSQSKQNMTQSSSTTEGE